MAAEGSGSRHLLSSLAIGAAAAVAAYHLWGVTGEEPPEEQEEAPPSPAAVEEEEEAPEDDDFLHVRYFDSGACLPLEGKTAADIPYDRAAGELPASATVGETLEVLLKNDASCVVVHMGTEWGILDLTDVVPSLLEHSLDRRLAEVVQREVLLSERTPLPDVLRHMRAGWRYTLVVGPRRPPEVLSQGSLLRHLSREHLGHPCFEATLEEKGLGEQRERLLVCRRGTTAAGAYRSMARHGITSLPCVDPEGHIEAVLSLSDAKWLAKMPPREVDAKLALEGREFARQSQGVAAGESPRVLTCIPQETLRGAIERMVVEAVHHLYVCPAGSRRVEGVVSVVDLLKSL